MPPFFPSCCNRVKSLLLVAVHIDQNLWRASESSLYTSKLIFFSYWIHSLITARFLLMWANEILDSTGSHSGRVVPTTIRNASFIFMWTLLSHTRVASWVDQCSFVTYVPRVELWRELRAYFHSGIYEMSSVLLAGHPRLLTDILDYPLVTSGWVL